MLKQKKQNDWVFLSVWESYPGSSPSQQSLKLLVQGFPHHYTTTTTLSVHLTGPVTPQHTKTQHSLSLYSG